MQVTDPAGRLRPDDVTFRRLTADDLGLLVSWLAEPGVVRWWEGDDVSPEAVARDHGPGNRWPQVEHWLAEVDGAPAGWIQCYPTAEEEDDEETQLWAPHLDLATAAGIDYLVGDPAARGRGLGTAMLTAFVDRVVFGRHPTWTHAAASPYRGNVASWRALAAAGFVHVADLDHDGPGGDGTDRDDGPLRLMVRCRDPRATCHPRHP